MDMKNISNCGCNGCSCGRCGSGTSPRSNQYRPDTGLSGFPLAMVYSPYQQFDNLYEPEEAICKGTLFAELDKPFYGSRRML